MEKPKRLSEEINTVYIQGYNDAWDKWEKYHKWILDNITVDVDEEELTRIIMVRNMEATDDNDKKLAKAISQNKDIFKIVVKE